MVDIRRQVNSGINSVPPRQLVCIEKGQTVPRLKFKAWFDNWKNGRGNPQPDSQEFHLAAGLKKGDVVKAYQELQSSSAETDETCCSHVGDSSSTLFRFMRQDFDHVKKRKHVRFTKCSVCTLIEDKKKKAKNDSRRQGMHAIILTPYV